MHRHLLVFVSVVVVGVIALAVRASPAPNLGARATDYAQSVRLTAPVKPTADGASNVYPVATQSAAVAAISRRFAGKSPLVLQGDAPGDGVVTRFTIAGEVRYDVEVAVVLNGMAMTPEVRAAIEAALQQVAGEAVNVQRVVLAAGSITVETDAGPRVIAFKPGADA